MYVEPIGLLSRVLHVPKLFVNLVSVQRIAKMDNFRIIFEDTDAILCNKVHGWKIGLAKVWQGLYHLPSTSPNNGRLSNGQTTALSSALEEGKVILLHR